MAKGASKCLFLLFLCLLTACSSGTLVGFSCRTRNTASSSTARALSFLKVNKVTPSQIRVFVGDHSVLSTLSDSGVTVDLCLSKSGHRSLLSSKSSLILWLKAHIMPFLPHVNINSIIITGGDDHSGDGELAMLLSTLKSIHSALSAVHLENQVKVSVPFSLPLLEKLRTTQERDLRRILGFIMKIRSYILIDDSSDRQSSMGDQFVQSVIERATLVSSLLPLNDVPVVLTTKSPAVPSAREVAQFKDKVLKSLENNTRFTGQVIGLYAEVSSMEDFVQKELKREEGQIFRSSHRELLSKSHLQAVLHDNFNPPTTIFPTTPISTTPAITAPDNPTPPFITVPATNPVSVTPGNPASTPLAIPSNPPVTVPSTNPANSSVPVTNPVTTPSTVPGAQPVTNPVTTYPPPTGAVPVTNPVAPPATTNAPAVPGQSWCIAKGGAPETALQSALDYACGVGGADCSQIQQGGSCYNPNTLQNHASFAFNSYYQKNPAPTSCDFGGTATIVNANPSTGSCIYSSSATTANPTPTPTANPTQTPTPTTTPPPTSTTPPATTTPTPTTTNPPGADASGYGSPPSVLNTSEPASGASPLMGSESPPGFNSSTSFSSGLQPFIGCIILVTYLVTAKLVLEM